MNNPPINITIEPPFDFVGSVLVPFLTVVISASIAVLLARLERVAARKDRTHAQGTQLIRALNATGRAVQMDDDDLEEASWSRYEQELNAFAAQLRRKEYVVAKYICIVVAKTDLSDAELTSRTLLWLATAIELWIRGSLRSRDFEINMPHAPTSWIEHIDLGQWDAVTRGQSATGIHDLKPH
jgi:hypothetical protein